MRLAPPGLGVGLGGLARRSRRRPPAASRPPSTSARWRWAPLRSGSASSMPSSRAHRRGPGQQPLRGARGAGTRLARVEVDQLAVHARSGSRARCSPRPAAAAGRANGTPSSSSRAACSTQATIRPRQRLGSRPPSAGRRRCAPRRCRRRSAGGPTTRPACTRRSSRVRDEELDVVAVGRPRAVGVGHAAAREAACVKVCVRAECRPESSPSRNGELALTASSSGSTGRSRSQTPHGAVGVADADVDVQREGVVAPGDVLQPVDDAAVVLGVDVRLLAVVGPRMRAGRAERDAVRRGEREQPARARSRWRASASARSSPRPERISISDGDQLAGDRVRERRVARLRGVAQLLEARHQVQRLGIEDRELLLEADGPVGRGRERPRRTRRSMSRRHVR